LAFVVREVLSRQEYDSEVVPTAEALFERLRGSVYDLILLDVKLPDMSGLDAIPRCRELAPDSPVIVMTAYGTRQIATEAITRGAYDFFTKPLKMAEFQVVVARALERRRLQQQVKALQAEQVTGFEDMIGRAEALTRVLERRSARRRRTSPSWSRGESGTGKELLARAVHRQSARKDGPFVAVNCAAIPEGLLESELFGHERGAFTGAVRTKPGSVRAGQGRHALPGRDRHMPLAMQAKILRALQEREFERVGGVRLIGADVRVIAPRTRTWTSSSHTRNSRPDLFYRLQGCVSGSRR